MSFKKFKLKSWLLGIGAFILILAGVVIIWVSTLQLPDFGSFNELKLQNSTKIYF
jgi:membrane carboxypeptidase/penicillin-binding protein